METLHLLLPLSRVTFDICYVSFDMYSVSFDIYSVSFGIHLLYLVWLRASNSES